MNTATRSEEKKVSESKPESDASFNRLAQSMLNKFERTKKRTNKIHIGGSKVVQKTADAVAKDLLNEQEKWLRKRKNEDLHQHTQIAKQIKNMLDPNDSGQVQFDDFFKFLIEIGVPLSPKIIQSTLLGTLIHKDKSVLKEESISFLCRGCKRTNQVLLTLNSHASQTFNKPKEEITSADQDALVKLWWKSLDSANNDQVSCNKVCEFLVSVSVCSDFPESKKFLSKIAHDQTFMDSSQFVSLFAKAIIKHSLVTINKKFSEEDWKNPVYSYAYKLSQLKRQLVLAGIKFPIPNISVDEGSIVLKATENYLRFKGEKIEKISYEEFKSQWYHHTGHKLDTKPLSTFSMISSDSEIELAEFFPKQESFENKDPNHRFVRRSTIKEEQFKQNNHKKLSLNYEISKIDKFRSEVLNKGSSSRRRAITRAERRCEKINILYNEFQNVVNRIIR